MRLGDRFQRPFAVLVQAGLLIHDFSFLVQDMESIRVGELAPAVGVDADTAAEAARLAKADLASQMVGEFPELQGVMGGYYARAAIGSASAGPRRYGEEVDP